MQYNRNNYNNEINVINKINNIMKSSNCGLPVGFTNIWDNGSFETNIDRQKMMKWRNQLANKLATNELNCNNIQVGFDMGKKLYNMYYKMIKIKGPLANYYNACLWEVTKMFLNMMNAAINKNNMILIFDKSINLHKKQYNKWNNKYKKLQQAYVQSKNNFYDFNLNRDGFLWEVYNSNFIKEKLKILHRYGDQIDPFLR